MHPRTTVLLGVFALALVLLRPVAVAYAQDIPRMPDGRPDLSGTYDTATLTPLQRPEESGNKLVLTEEEAATIAATARARRVARNEASDPDREAPPVGGDGSPGAAGNVGGYNTFWIDRGTAGFQINEQWRTSIIVDPRTGDGHPSRPTREVERRPALGAFAQTRAPRGGSRTTSTHPGHTTIRNCARLRSAVSWDSARPPAPRCFRSFTTT